jgi:hypothetical protein
MSEVIEADGERAGVGRRRRRHVSVKGLVRAYATVNSFPVTLLFDRHATLLLQIAGRLARAIDGSNSSFSDHIYNGLLALMFDTGFTAALVSEIYNCNRLLLQPDRARVNFGLILSAAAILSAG